MVIQKDFIQKVRKIGTSWGIIIPKHVLKDLNLENSMLKEGVDLKVKVCRTANDIIKQRQERVLGKALDAGLIYMKEDGVKYGK